MADKETYTAELITNICTEIEKQWRYFLYLKAAFPYNLENSLPHYSSPPYYQSKGINLSVIYHGSDELKIVNDLDGVGHWLNQNYIIRLFGILNEHGIITYGRLQKNNYTNILARLRHRVGTHNRGDDRIKDEGAKEIANLIQERFDQKVSADDIERFNLSIDKVLEPLKEHLVNLVHDIEGKIIPKKSDKVTKKLSGVDACKTGWFIFSINENDEFSYRVIPLIDELKDHVSSEDKILIDIPIGLKTTGAQERICDKEARKVLGKRGSSVFPVPSRLAFDADTYESASAINYDNCGRKLSKQTWAIIPKIKEVDVFMQKEGSNYCIREMHPEVCFWALNVGAPMNYNKKKSDGFNERLTLLQKYAPNIEKVVCEILQTYKRKEVAKDDILDAAVGAVTLRFAKELKTIPEIPEVDDKGLKMEMVYADIVN